MVEERLAALRLLTGGADTRDRYDDWAAEFDADMRAAGYAAPERVSAALASATSERGAPVLDLGCGTGLVGAALRAAGFATVDGLDASTGMLERARTKSLYRALIAADLGEPLSFAPGDYRHATAAGVLGPGHAPAQVIDGVLALLPPGGCFAFSLSNHAAAVSDYRARINENIDCGFADLLSRDYGAYLPVTAIKGNVYVLRRR